MEFDFSSWKYVFSFTATTFFAQSNIATVRDAVIGPFGVFAGFTNVTRTVAVTIPSAPFFTLFGSRYTGLPVDVLPISCHFACATLGSAGAGSDRVATSRKCSTGGIE